MVMMVAAAGMTAAGETVRVRVETARSALPEVTTGVKVVAGLVLEDALVLQFALTPAGSPLTIRLATLPVAKDPPAVTVMASVEELPC